MTAPITSYSTTDAVRACLGVTDNEMSDTMLLDMGLSIAVLIDLESFLADHSNRWLAAKGASPTADQINIGRNLELYCNWTGAAHAIKAYLAIPQEISDGKASIKRFSTDSPKRALLEANNMSNRYKTALEGLTGTTAYSAASPMGAASPSYDPITGVDT